MLGLFIVGLVLGRISFFTNPDRYKAKRRWILATSFVASLLLYFWAGGELDSRFPVGPVHNILHTALDTWIGLAVMTTEVLLFIELFESAVQPLARLFAAPGRMTLTLYVGQSIVFTPVFYGYGLSQWDKLKPGEYLAIGAASFVLQVIVPHWWFHRFHYGPLEWLWRAATRTSLDVPFVKQRMLAAA